MSLYHTGLFISCEEVDCKAAEIIPNPGGHSDAVLEGKATMARPPYRVGWYLPVYGGGKRMCPNHHQIIADKEGVDSLYVGRLPIGIPIKKDEAKKSAKKHAAKEGAD